MKNTELDRQIKELEIKFVVNETLISIYGDIGLVRDTVNDLRSENIRLSQKLRDLRKKMWGF